MGVAVNSEKPAKTSSKAHLQIRTVPVNTCACLLVTRRSVAHASYVSRNQGRPLSRDRKMRFDIDQGA